MRFGTRVARLGREVRELRTGKDITRPPFASDGPHFSEVRSMAYLSAAVASPVFDH
jgi:hypothetical protein